MSSNPRERLLILATLAIIAAFAGDRFILEPLLGVWKARNERIALLRQDLARGQTLLRRQDSIEDIWKTMRAHSLPADTTVAQQELLTAVGNWANTSQLNVTSLKPRRIDGEDSANLLEVRVTASGSLTSIARFLYELERDPLAVRLLDVDLRSRDDRGADLSLDVRFTGLVLPEVKP